MRVRSSGRERTVEDGRGIREIDGRLNKGKLAKV